MRGIRTGLWTIMLLLVTTAAAFAQATTGTMRGHVGDAQGLPLPGATVSVTSPNLQGTRTTVTSENGDYVLTLLPSGTYVVSFELSGFERVQRTVTLAPMQDLPVEVQLGVAALNETVQVTGSVIMQTPQVTANYTQDLISTLPTTRDINATILQAPAVHATGPRGAYSIGGATSFESLIMVNGVATTDNLRGTPFDLYIEDAVQETAVTVSGVSAEHGRFSGGVVNVITKSGGNDFSGSFRDTYNNDSWRTLSPFEETQIANDPQHKELRLDKSVPTYEYTFGGPALKDRLWFFTAGRIQTQSSNRTLNVTRIPYTYEDKTRRYEAKGTYSQTASHRFQFDYLKINEQETNYTFNGASSASMDERSLGNRETPQDIYAIGYTGVLTPRLSVEARYSARHFEFVGAGARSTDEIEGTLLLDQSRSPNGRYWSDTFCGVCTPEKRDNEDYFFKGTYFLSPKGLGSHNMIFGYDNFDDIREANNHQSGSDFRIYGSGIWLDGTNILPKFVGTDDSTLIQYNPITQASQGSDFRTHSLFYNDTWRVNGRLTANLGLRWDKNHGIDQSGALVVHDGRFSPRFGVVWDPSGSGVWSVTGSFGKYVAAISNAIADNSSAAGNPQTYIYYYRGPSVNATAGVTPTADAIRTVLNWYKANINSLVLEENPDLPGLTPQVGENLRSPFVYEYSTGVSRQLGSRASVRVDGSYRQYHDFYAERIDGSTGKVMDSFGQEFDLALIENTDALKRQYAGLIFQGNYRTGRTQMGAQYTLSRAWGNFEGEDVNSGPLPSDTVQYPEYKQESWNYPDGDLQVDQRHRARLYVNYGVPKLNGMVVSVMQTLESGVPYGASNLNSTAKNGVDPRPYVTGAPDYENPPSGQSTIYFFTPRDAYRTDGQKRTDLAVNYAFDFKSVRGLSRLQAFAQAQFINIFDQSQLCGCGQSVFGNGGSVTQTNIDTTVRTAVTTSSLKTFNPFVDTPVEGVNWAKGPAFGTARNRFAYTSPRQFRFSFGVRF